MRKLNSSLHLRPFLRRISSSSTTTTTTPFLSPPSNPLSHHPFSPSSITNNRLYPPPFPLSRTFCSKPDPILKTPEDETEQLAASLSVEITPKPENPGNPDVESVPIAKRLQLSYSHVKLTPTLLLKTLNISPDAGRGAFQLFEWVKSRSDFKVTDEVISYFVQYFGRRKDFKAINDLLVIGKGVIGDKCFESTVDRLVRAGRRAKTVSFFNTMEGDYGFVKSLDKLKVVIGKLCEHGYASYAEKMAKNWANDFFPDQEVCDMLIKGWCVDNKFDEALRLAGEMYNGGFELTTYGCNQILDCVCRLCRKKDPHRFKSETERVLMGMEERGIPRDVETFNVLISNLCAIRKTEDAIKLYGRMGEWGCQPNETTYLVLIRSLYQAARVGEGDEMIAKMKSAGYGSALNVKEYFGYLRRLCGIERIDHAMKVFAMMKADGCKPGVRTYDLLMGKLVAHGQVGRASDLLKEAEKLGLQVELKPYKVDPRLIEKKAVKKGKKKMTFVERMAARKLPKQIRVKYVKKPKRKMRRAY